MKKIISCAVLLFGITIFYGEMIMEAKSAYLGSELPGVKAKMFAPAVLKSDFDDYGATFSPDGKEMFFTRRDSAGIDKIMRIDLTKGQDARPEPVSFTGIYLDFEPHIMFDGKSMLYGSVRRPAGAEANAQPEMHWYCAERTKEGWAEPKLLNVPFNDRFIMYVTVARSKTMYFTGMEPGTKQDQSGLYYSTYEKGVYTEPVRMDASINGGAMTAHPFIALDESYLLFDSIRAGGKGQADIYICFKEKDGTWSKPINLGIDVNTGAKEMFPSVTPDGKYLFFGSTRRGKLHIYWSDFQALIKKLRAK